MNKPEYQSPPRWSMRLLKALIHPEYLEEIEGDMEEVFQDNLNLYSAKKASRLYHKEVFKLMRPALVKRLVGSQKLNYYGMFKHNILLSLRIFKRYKSSFLINLTGLASGLSCVLLIYLWLSDELAIDRFHEHGDRLYQVMGNHPGANGIDTWNGTPIPLAAHLEDNIPEIDKVISLTDPAWQMEFELTTEAELSKAVGKYAGKDYFRMFTNPLILGNPDQVLGSPDGMVITEKLAINLFGDIESALGQDLDWKVMQFEGKARITGICETPPSYSTDQFDFILSMEAYEKDFGTSWQNPNSVTYVLLQEGAALGSVNTKIKDILSEQVTGNERELFLAKYEDQYLYNRYENGKIAGGRIEYVRIFGLIALFILLIACINFMNLSTARASRRLKEIGVKKAVGATRSNLIFQHLSESVLMAFLSLLVALILTNLFLPQFNLITGKSLVLTLDGPLIASALSITLVTGLISGSYPALYLSGFNPLMVLKGTLKSSTGEFWVRKGLVVFQFAITIIFIAGVLIVSKQLLLIQNKELGFDKDHIVYFQREGATTDMDNYNGFLQNLRTIPGVVNASAITHSFFGPPGSGKFTWEGMEDRKYDINRFIVYNDIVSTMGIKLLEGRDFSAEYPLKDEWQIIINESAAALMGFEDPVGKKAKYWGIDARIVGVVEDFHYHSLHKEIGPAFFQLDPSFLVNTLVRIQAGTERETLGRIEDFYKSYNPGYGFNYQFLDQEFQALYQNEGKVAALVRYFAGLAILISCLGLLGLVSFTAEKRTKEIGIRKVLGSSRMSIVLLLSKDFTKMVLLSIVIALPVSYYFCQQWLGGFAYAIDLKWWLFAATGLFALIIAWLTVGWQTLKVARTSPSLCLRSE